MKYVSVFLFVLSAFVSHVDAQVLSPVEWSFEVAQDGDTYTLTATADMEDKWVIYSQHTGEGGPIPMTFTYESDVDLIGKTVEESEAITEMSEMFMTEVIKFKKKGVFTQKFKAKSGVKNIKGYLTFMCCDSKRCLPPTDVSFDIAL